MQQQLLVSVELTLIKYLTGNFQTMSVIKIKQVRSAIKRPADQKATIKALGFKRLNHVVEKEGTPQILGMINKVKHLIQIID